MSQEPFALSTIPPQPLAEGDYETICGAVRASARGRWFLDEYARRNRNADTEVVLAAIERVEAATRAGRDREAFQSVRGDLLEMARTIAVTRAEVAEAQLEVHEQSPPAAEPPAPAASEVFAMAERIQDVAWTMRERGIDPRTCEQIETLAATILSASSLRDPNDHRARNLGEVLRYLEQRIDGMLDACAREAQEKSEAPNAYVVEAEMPAPPAGNGHDLYADYNAAVASPVTAAEPSEAPAAQPLEPFGSDDPTEMAAALGIDATVAGQADEGLATSEPLAAAVGGPNTMELVAPTAVSAPEAAADVAPAGPAGESAIVEPPEAKAEDDIPAAMSASTLEIAPAPIGAADAGEPALTPAARHAAEANQTKPPREDPLAALKALSYAERIALFT